MNLFKETGLTNIIVSQKMKMSLFSGMLFCIVYRLDMNAPISIYLYTYNIKFHFWEFWHFCHFLRGLFIQIQNKTCTRLSSIYILIIQFDGLNYFVIDISKIIANKAILNFCHFWSCLFSIKDKKSLTRFHLRNNLIPVRFMIVDSKRFTDSPLLN